MQMHKNLDYSLSYSHTLHLTHVDCLDLFKRNGPESLSPEERSEYFVW